MKITEGNAFLSPELNDSDRPSCHVCGSAMVKNWHCTSCLANTYPEAALSVQGESAEAHALEFLKEFCGLHESGVVGDSITVLHTHKGSESGYWVIDSEGNKRRWKEILAIYAQRVNAELSAANSDLMAQLAELQKQQTNLACMSIENLISSGNQNVRSLQERAEKSEAMLADAQRNRI